MAIEVEKRGLLTKERYLDLISRLHKDAIEKGENNTETFFYLQESAQTKVQRNVSSKSAKIAWKSGGNSGTEKRTEIELAIQYKDYDLANTLVKKLLTDAQVFSTNQLRRDYVLDGVQIALKYSEDWGYHAELEQVVDSDAGVDSAIQSITSLADKLDIRLLSKEEEREFVAARIAEHK